MPGEYEFTLRFSVPASVDADLLVGRLFEAGCDDALIGSGEAGCIGMQFTRAAESAAAAVGSAVRDVRRGVSEIRLIGTRWDASSCG